jgi:ubiquinone/menaquinone biosynthesis C-methylase UbiE
VTTIKQFHVRYRFIASLPRDAIILDIGCGTGFVENNLKSYRKDIKFISIDNVDFSNYFTSGGFFKVDVTKDALPFKSESFDAIFCCHVLEHLTSYDLLLSEISRVLKPNGSVYLETPGTRSLYLPSLGFWSDLKATSNFYDDPTHIRPFTKIALYRIATQIGVKQIKTGFARNFMYCLLAPLIIPYTLLKADKQKLVTVIWSLAGSCVYVWGKYLDKEKPR